MSRKTTPTYVLLNQITLAANTNSVTFSNIPQNYGDLVLVASGQVSDYDILGLQFNGDTGSNYSYVYMVDLGSAAATTNMARFGRFSSGSGKTSSSFAQIMDYSATDKHKTVLGRGNSPDDSIWAYASRWGNTAAVTSFRIITPGSVNFQIGSTFYLYGLVA